MSVEQTGFRAGERIGAYQIVQRLGQNEGRMAQLYLATLEVGRNSQSVVLKVANVRNRAGDYSTDALQNEVTYLQRFHHPNIVQLLPVASDQAPALQYVAQLQPPRGPYFAVLEYLAHGSLAKFLEIHSQGLPLWMALEIGYSLASALDYLHGYGLVHMDLKPHNILFRRPFTEEAAGKTVLIDFGSARPVGESERELNATFRASPYLAPEWIEAAHADRIVAGLGIDVYALGVILYQMITGRLPFQGDTHRALEQAILAGQWRPLTQSWGQDRPTSNPQAPRLLDQLFYATLHRDAAQRCSAGTLAERIAEARFLFGDAIGHDSRDRNFAIGDPISPPKRRATWVSALALNMLILCGGVGVGAIGTTLYGNGKLHGMDRALPVSTPTSTATLRATPTETATLTPTNTPIATPTETATPLPTATSTPSATPTPAPTQPLMSTLAPVSP